MNMFAYCNNNPVNFGDDGGGFAISLTAAAIGIGKLLFDLAATYIFVEAAWEVGKAVGNTVSDYSKNAKSKPKGDAPSVPATGGSTPASPGGPGRGNKGNYNNSRSWNKGSYGSSQESLQNHYERHGMEVGARNPIDYMNKASSFASNLRGARTRRIDGFTRGVVRYIKNGKYIDLAQDGSIISYGKWGW